MFDFSPTKYKSKKKDKSKDKNTEFRIGDSKKFSIENLLLSVLGSKKGERPVDIVIDDSSMPEAPNFVTFLNGSEFLNIRGWARQNEIGTKLFADYCPRCTDMEWFHKNPRGQLSVPKKASIRKFLEHVQPLEFDTCPKCGAEKWELLKSKELAYHDELCGVAGQRASKSAIVSMLNAYITHKYLKMQKPTEVLGLLRNTMLHGTFVALTYGQAKETLWDPFYSLLTDSPWFSKYHKLLDEYNSKTGEEIYKLKDSFVLYRHRNLLIYPSGPNKKTLRGRTRFLASIDELGWFDNDVESDKGKVRMDANEVYIALERSLLTVRAAANKLIRKQRSYVIPGLFANVSSPSSRRDKIMTLYRASESVARMFAFKHATWEINPEISKSDLASEFTKSPLEAERDYGANPPLSSNPFFNSIEVIEKSLKLRNNVALTPKISVRSDGSRYSYADILKPSAIAQPSILAIDAGYSNNSFAFSVATVGSKVGTVRIPALGEVIPKVGHPINYSRMYTNVLKPIIKAFNVKLLVADRWQSIKVLHDAEEDFPGLSTMMYSITYEDMILVREALEAGLIALPKLDAPDLANCIEYDPANYPGFFRRRPVAHLVLQMVSVRDTGSDVVKGDVTDDLWRSVALGSAFAIDKEYQSLLNGPLRAVGGTGGLGVALGKSGGARGSSGGSSSSMGVIKSRSGR